MKVKTIPSKLTDQQRYLLGRIPNKYDLAGEEPRPEPTEVKKARSLIKKWDDEEAKLQCRAKQRNEAIIRKAREAVYFAPAEKALAIVQQCEKLLKGCPV